MTGKDLIVPGMSCTVVGWRDLGMVRWNYNFINKECLIVKETKAGLIQVCLKDDLEFVGSFARYDIELKMSEGE